MIVLDTSALLYWTLDPAELTLNAEKAIVNADKVVVSSISLWEIALAARFGCPLVSSDSIIPGYYPKTVW